MIKPDLLLPEILPAKAYGTRRVRATTPGLRVLLGWSLADTSDAEFLHG
jgi:hypothetical protein